MIKPKLRKKVLFLFLAIVLGGAIYYCWLAFPIISGGSAKIACSCSFIQGRKKESIEKEELGALPLSLGSIRVDNRDSSVTATVFGLARKKAIFRKGLGCTLVNEIPEKNLRAQSFIIPQYSSKDSGYEAVADSFPIGMLTGPGRGLVDSALSFVFQETAPDKKRIQGPYWLSITGQ